ncbi:class I SAM-dependent methyltransferase [Kitasatospora sp. NPDC057223]|uniref:class I SAM-dependent methyltransferase n=1 Tax=Kitasatospora sp. NPDC057223 TaxID=3346055 RepID=UPI00363BF560
MDSHDWDARYGATDLVWGVEPNRWVVRECADLPAGRALDLAAGEGRNSIWLAARGWRVTAVDFSQVAVDRGRRLAAAGPPEVAGRLDWVRADALGYRPEPGGHDLVLIVYLHLPAAERRRVLDLAATALAPGATLLVVGHATANLTEGSGGPQDARVLYSPGDIVADLAGHGLRTVRAEHVHRSVATADGASARAVDALVRLERPQGAG